MPRSTRQSIDFYLQPLSHSNTSSVLGMQAFTVQYCQARSRSLSESDDGGHAVPCYVGQVHVDLL